MLKLINSVLIVCLILLITRMVRGNGSLVEVRQLQATIKQQQDNLQVKKNNNAALLKELEYLKTQPMAIEEQARVELGMVKQGESYYQVIEPIE